MSKLRKNAYYVQLIHILYLAKSCAVIQIYKYFFFIFLWKLFSWLHSISKNRLEYLLIFYIEFILSILFNLEIKLKLFKITLYKISMVCSESVNYLVLSPYAVLDFLKIFSNHKYSSLYRFYIFRKQYKFWCSNKSFV